MSWKEGKGVEYQAETLVLTAVSPWFLSVYGMLSCTHFSVGIMVESGSDLSEKCRALEGRCTVRWILDIQAFGMWSERSYIHPWLAHVAELMHAFHTWSSGYALWPLKYSLPFSSVFMAPSMELLLVLKLGVCLHNSQAQGLNHGGFVMTRKLYYWWLTSHHDSHALKW